MCAALILEVVRLQVEFVFEFGEKILIAESEHRSPKVEFGFVGNHKLDALQIHERGDPNFALPFRTHRTDLANLVRVFPGHRAARDHEPARNLSVKAIRTAMEPVLGDHRVGLFKVAISSRLGTDPITRANQQSTNEDPAQ